MGAIAVTGADGFIGARLCSLLETRDIETVRIVRRRSGPGSNRRVVTALEEESDLTNVLAGVEAVVHLAGRAHVLHETEADPEAAFYRVNVEATVRLARASIASGVRRFVFVSSIGVNGNATHGRPFTETDTPAPVEPYARSKLRGEQHLQEICAGSPLELVVVRPPLVYGAGAGGNFARLVRLAASGVPLPIAQIRNRRSLIGVSNLCDLLLVCAQHPGAPGQLFLAAEPGYRSTPEVVEALARALDRPPRLFRLPTNVLRFAAAVVGKRQEFEKLCGSLEVSGEKARDVLGWQPSVPFEDEIARVGKANRPD